MADRFVAFMPVTIRPCRHDDLFALEWFGMFREHREILHEIFAAAERGEQIMIVAEVNGFPAGQAWIELARDRLWAVRVLPPLRRVGIGRRMVQVAERLLQRRGRQRMQVAVDKNNVGGLRFWERAGYAHHSATVERWWMRTPEGSMVESAADLWILEKVLARGEHAGHSLDDR